MTHSRSGIVALIACTAAVVAAGTLWVRGPSDTFRKARSAERVRDTFDALGIIQLDVALTQAAHRTLLLLPDARARAEYEAQRTLRDQHLDSIAARTVRDTVMSRQLRALHARFAELDSFRTSLSDVAARTSSPDSLVALLRSLRASDLRSNVQYELALLEGEQRRRLAELQPTLDRQRDWVATAIPMSLAVVALVLGWLLFALGAEATRARRRAEGFRRTLDDSPDGVMVHRDGVVLYANAEAAALLGASADNRLEGRSILDLVFADDRPAIGVRIKEAQDGGRLAPRLTRMARLDGSVVETETRGAAVDWNGTPAAQVTLRDVAARRRSEIALAQSEKRFRTVLDTMAEGVVLQDEQLAIHLSNRAAERILGMTADQMAGKTSLDPGWMAIDVDGDPLPGEQHFAPIALRTGLESRGTMGVKRGDGSRVWIDVIAVPMIRDGESKPYAVVVTFTDVSVTLETTKRLELSEARYRLVAENTVDLITLRANDDRLLYVSPSHRRILGWEPEELEGRPGLELVHPDDIESMKTGRIQLFNPTERGSGTLRIRHRDGHYLWVEVVAAPIAVDNGVVTTYAVSARDITERMHLEEALRQAQKMESMGRMASGIAHDFNNLLTAIRASAEFLSISAPSTGNVREGTAEIIDGVDRAASLTAQLLAFSRGQHSSPELLDCAALLESNRNLLVRLVSPHATLTVFIDSDTHLATIFADRSQFEQVLFNLVTNARDAAPRNGRVHVALSLSTITETVAGQFGALSPGDYVVLRVEDDGAGIPADALPQVFDPFFTTKMQGQGTGLGLATVFGIVQHHAGAVTAINRATGGAQFTVYWPRRDAGAFQSTLIREPSRVDDETTGGALGAEPGTASRRRRTILLVDDEAAVRRTVAKLLESHGFHVLQAESGEEAIAILSETNSQVDALVTDVKMPGMTGVELVEALFVQRIDLPVLFISGQIDDPIPVEWPTGSPRHFLRKPFRGNELTDEMRRLLGIE